MHPRIEIRTSPEIVSRRLAGSAWVPGAWVPVWAVGLMVVSASICICTARDAAARPGFYLGLGIGPTSVGGSDVPSSQFGVGTSGVAVEEVPGVPWRTHIAGGPSALVRVGYNILGYAAVESMLTGHGTRLGDATSRAWAAHWHIGARAYPLWYWQHRLPGWLQPLEPSLFAGWGVSYQVYAPEVPYLDDVGWRTAASMRFGGGLEYFVLSFLKVALDYNHIRAPYNTFVFNYADNDTYPLNRAAVTGYHQLYLSLALQFGLAG